MKFALGDTLLAKAEVAPCAGAWIEIFSQENPPPPTSVAPCAGAWIEIVHRPHGFHGAQVAPCAGAWIEMLSMVYNIKP